MQHHLVSCGVGPPLWFGNYFWVRTCASDLVGTRFGCRCTALRLASLAFAPLRASQTPRRKNNTKKIHVCLFCFSPYSLIKSTTAVSCWHGEGGSHTTVSNPACAVLVDNDKNDWSVPAGWASVVGLPRNTNTD
jgi:hypothetical protein